jgi:hypothetical protein
LHFGKIVLGCIGRACIRAAILSDNSDDDEPRDIGARSWLFALGSHDRSASPQIDNCWT